MARRRIQRRVARALVEVQRTARARDAVVQCESTHPGLTCRCQLVAGHEDSRGTDHRHRVLGTQAVVTWR